MIFRFSTRLLICTVCVAVVISIVPVFGRAQQETAPRPTRTTFSSSARQVVSGESVTLTGTVSAIAPADGTPSGSVEFFDGATSLGSANLASVDGRMQGSLSLTNLSVGPHPITVRYSGDTRFGSSVSPPQFVLVVAAQ